MWRFVFKGTLRGALLNADPHPGNYVFHPEGIVTFLDYGCIQEVEEAHRAHAEVVHRSALARDNAAFGKAISILVRAKPGALEKLAIAYSRTCFEPLFGSPYRITKGYAASLVAGMKDMAVAAKKMKDEEFFSMPPEMFFTNRLQFGFYSVLARLDVEVDYAQVERDFLDPPAATAKAV